MGEGRREIGLRPLQRGRRWAPLKATKYRARRTQVTSVAANLPLPGDTSGSQPRSVKSFPEQPPCPATDPPSLLPSPVVLLRGGTPLGNGSLACGTTAFS